VNLPREIITNYVLIIRKMSCFAELN